MMAYLEVHDSIPKSETIKRDNHNFFQRKKNFKKKKNSKKKKKISKKNFFFSNFFFLSPGNNVTRLDKS